MPDGKTKKAVPPPLPPREDAAEPAAAAPAAVDGVEAFLAQAAGIISLERGINARSRVKLAALADELDLDEDQLDRAMTKLLGGGAAKEKKLSREELRDLRRRKGAFHDTVGETLMALPGGVLTASMERMLILTGVEDHGLTVEEARAEIIELASKLRIRRITEEEAIRHVREIAAAKIGPSGVLSDDVRQRIYAEASRWGLTPDQVQPILKSCVSNVRQGEQRQQYRTVALISVSAAVLMGVLVMILWMAFSHALPGPEKPPAVADGDDPAGGDPPDTSPDGGSEKPPPTSMSSGSWGVPKWWDEPLSSFIANARLRVPQCERELYQLRSPDSKDRIAAYTRLVAVSRRDDRGEEQQAILGGLLATAYAIEPDDACATQIRAELMSTAAGPGDKLPENIGEYRASLWAVETAVAALIHDKLSPERSAALVAELQRKLHATIDQSLPPARLQRQIMAAAAVHLYKSLTRTADENVDLAVDLHEQLLEEIHVYLDTAAYERLATDYLVAVLPALGERWSTYETLIGRCAQSEDPLNVLKMVDVFERTSQAALQRFLEVQLSLRVGLRATSRSVAELAAEVRTALGAAELTRPRDDAERNKQWQLQADEAIARAAPSVARPTELLRQKLEMARLSTLAAALAKRELGAADYDELWEKEAPDLDEETSSSAPTGGGSPRLSSGQLRALDRSISALRNHRRVDKFQTLANLRNVSTFTGSITDVTPEQGQDIATYLAAAKAVDEHEQVMTLVDGMLRWKMVRLGLADQLAESRLRTEHLQQLLERALHREIDMSDGWRERSRDDLLVGVARQLKTEESLGSSRNDPHDRAARALTEYYRTQARLAGMGAEAYREAATPGEVLRLLVEQQAAQLSAIDTSPAGAAAKERIEHELTVTDYLGGNDLTRTAAFERMLVELRAAQLRKTNPGREAEIEGLLDNLRAAHRDAENVLQQLYENERAALRLWRLSI